MWKFALFFLSTFFFTACSTSSLHQSSVIDEQAQTPALHDSTPSPFTGENLRLIGRFDTRAAGQAQFTWPGSAVEFRFSGTAANMVLASNGKVRFQVDVDGISGDLWVDEGEASYTLVSGLPEGEHRVKLTRLTESFSMVTTLMSDPVVDGKLLAAPAPAEKRLLVLGDSITAGYGVEGADQSCGYAAATSNQQLTYAALATNALGADLHAIAWSGIGAYRSYAEKTPVNPTILTRYQRTLADDPESRWQVRQYQPDAVVIAIGTNDYWEGSVSDDYSLAMQALITQMQTDYPAKPIYLMVSPMLNGVARASQTAVLNSLAGNLVTVVDLGKIEASDGFGCDYHPNIVTQQRMAQALQQRLEDDLNW